MIRLLVAILAFILNNVYSDRPLPRFYVLETVARVPYFAYVCVLHLHETVGWCRKEEWLKVHFAEYWNELHHLLIMEALGGNQYWIDRFAAKHIALIYFWIIVIIYICAPRSAYQFMELVEEQAYRSYDQYLKANATELKSLPAPQIAIDYYRDGELYLFDAFQVGSVTQQRRPAVNNLYDVFVNIRDDEGEHLKTMLVCQENNTPVTPLSPASSKAIAIQSFPH